MGKTRRFSGIDGLNKTLRAWPKAANAELKDAAMDVAQDVADKAKARGGPGVISKVIPTLRPRKDRVPKLAMGGAAAAYRFRKGKGQRPGDVVFGAEFGGRRSPTTMHLKPHLGRTGYALWPTLRDEEDRTKQAYADAVLDALRRA